MCLQWRRRRYLTLLSTATSRLFRRFTTGRRGQKLLSTVVAAKVELLTITIGAKSGCFVYGHSADGVFGNGFWFFHGHIPFLVVGCCLQILHRRRNCRHFLFKIIHYINTKIFFTSKHSISSNKMYQELFYKKYFTPFQIFTFVSSHKRCQK